jgi:hypothetical protein
MDLTKQFQELFNGTSLNKNKIEGSVKICKETSVGFAEWIIEKHKQYPESVLRFDKLFDIYEKEKQTKKKSMFPPKQKADELFTKISLLMSLKHDEILEVLDFLVETKIISKNTELQERKYWEEVRLECKKINQKNGN